MPVFASNTGLQKRWVDFGRGFRPSFLEFVLQKPIPRSLRGETPLFPIMWSGFQLKDAHPPAVLGTAQRFLIILLFLVVSKLWTGSPIRSASSFFPIAQEGIRFFL